VAVTSDKLLSSWGIDLEDKLTLLLHNGVSPRRIEKHVRPIRRALSFENMDTAGVSQALEEAAGEFAAAEGHQVVPPAPPADAGRWSPAPGLSLLTTSRDGNGNVTALWVWELKAGGGRWRYVTVDGRDVRQGTVEYLRHWLEREPTAVRLSTEHPGLAQAVRDGRVNLGYKLVQIDASLMRVTVRDLILDARQLDSRTVILGGR
jgi:hypothetical protein